MHRMPVVTIPQALSGKALQKSAFLFYVHPRVEQTGYTNTFGTGLKILVPAV